MTKKEIIKNIAKRSNLTQNRAKEIVEWTFDAIVETLVQEGRIELRNFGIFEVRQRKERKARNPRTGESIDVPPKNVVTFAPGREMEMRLRDAKPLNVKPRSTFRVFKPDPIIESTIVEPAATLPPLSETEPSITAGVG